MVQVRNFITYKKYFANFIELPIHDVIAQRHKERHGTEFTPAGQTPSVLKKFICWRLDARGAVGETVNYFVFHI